jgi:hypothetical protein
LLAISQGCIFIGAGEEFGELDGAGEGLFEAFADALEFEGLGEIINGGEGGDEEGCSGGDVGLGKPHEEVDEGVASGMGV